MRRSSAARRSRCWSTPRTARCRRWTPRGCWPRPRSAGPSKVRAGAPDLGRKRLDEAFDVRGAVGDEAHDAAVLVEQPDVATGQVSTERGPDGDRAMHDEERDPLA